MGKKITVIILVLLVLFAGGGAALRWSPQTEAQQVWEPELLLLSSETLQKERNLARWYNLKLRETIPEKTSDGVYAQLLDFGAGKMGYLEIPALEVWQPIVHEGESQWQKDTAVHSFGTALPVGGKGNCPVLRCGGDGSSIAAGDIFCIHILDTVLIYQAASVGGELPEAAKGEDRCVLVFSSEAGTVYVTGIRTQELGI